jgi:hypothetical protein
VPGSKAQVGLILIVQSVLRLAIADLTACGSRGCPTALDAKETAPCQVTTIFRLRAER